MFLCSQEFTGSAAGGDVADFHALSPTIVAHRHVRFVPASTSICLRVEIYGTPGINLLSTHSFVRLVEPWNLC